MRADEQIFTSNLLAPPVVFFTQGFRQSDLMPEPFQLIVTSALARMLGINIIGQRWQEFHDILIIIFSMI